MKIENVREIDNIYTSRLPDQAHIVPIYRIDFTPDVDLMDFKTEIISINGNRTLFSTKTESLKPYKEILHKNMMECAKELFCNSKIMRNHWFWLNEDTFDKKCIPYTEIVEDKKGHYMTQHLDNPTILANFIINLSDNQSSTEFLDYKDTTKVIYKAESKKNTGVLFFNTGGAVHKITVIDDIRHMLMGSILLDINIKP